MAEWSTQPMGDLEEDTSIQVARIQRAAMHLNSIGEGTSRGIADEIMQAVEDKLHKIASDLRDARYRLYQEDE